MYCMYIIFIYFIYYCCSFYACTIKNNKSNLYKLYNILKKVNAPKVKNKLGSIQLKFVFVAAQLMVK